MEGQRTLLRSVAGPGIRVVVETETSGPPVLADPPSLEQALLNLVTNAIDAMPRGGTLTVRTAHTVQDGQERQEDHEGPDAPSPMSIEVLDTGHGIAPSVIDRVFDPFFTTKPAHEGSGLGLSSAREMVRRFGGDLAIHRTSSEGTCVRILLQSAPVDTPALVPVEESIPPEEDHETLDLKVLMIEDNPMVRAAVLRALTGAGIQAEPVGDLDEARTAWLAQPFDVVLADIILADGRVGTEVLSMLEADGVDTPVVFMSGYTEPPTPGTGLELKAGENFIAKPFSRAAALQILKRAATKQTTSPDVRG